MDDLQRLRTRIDEIDARMIDLFEQRMALSEQVAEYKRTHAQSVLQTGREDDVRAHAVECLRDKRLAPHAVEFVNAVMDVSKDYQHERLGHGLWRDGLARETFDLHAPKGYFGAQGSNTEQAMREFFGNSDGAIAYDKFEDVFRAIDGGEIRYGVVPIENSSTGAIDDVYDLLGKYDLYIVGEHWSRIRHCLWGVEGSTLDTVRDVYSHPQGLAQCKAYVERRGYTPHAYHDTAASAALVAAQADVRKAAIAGECAGKRYGLSMLDRDIQTCGDNFTRFVVISKTLTRDKGDKVGIRFGLYSASGTLFRALRYFARYGINMIMLESRPVLENPCNYWFYVDLEGSLQDDSMRQALGVLAEHTTSMRVLGEYRKGEWK